MMVDLDTLNDQDLEALIAAAEVSRRARLQAARQAFVVEVKERMAALTMSVPELTAGLTEKPKRSYRRTGPVAEGAEGGRTGTSLATGES